MAYLAHAHKKTRTRCTPELPFCTFPILWSRFRLHFFFLCRDMWSFFYFETCVRFLISQHSFDFLFITETWLRNTIGDNHIFLADYNLIRRDRTSGQHGGVCFYTRNHIKCRRLDKLEDPNFEVLWVHTRPPRLSRRVPCVIAACVYHPPSSFLIGF